MTSLLALDWFARLTLQTLIGAAICVLLVTAGCKRSQTNQQTISGVGSGTSSNSVGGREQARVYLEKGKQLYRDDDDSAAAEAFEQALKLDPDLAETYFRLGLAYEALDKAEEADDSYKKGIGAYRKELADNPNDAEAHYNLGQTYAALHRYSEAVREYRQAARLKANDSEIYCDLGTALAKLAQYDEAASAFSKSLEIDAENYRARDGLEDAREGVQRIKAGKKHQEELLKKQKEEELKKQQGDSPEGTPAGQKPQVVEKT